MEFIAALLMLAFCAALLCIICRQQREIINILRRYGQKKPDTAKAEPKPEKMPEIDEEAEKIKLRQKKWDEGIESILNYSLEGRK